MALIRSGSIVKEEIFQLLSDNLGAKKTYALDGLRGLAVLFVIASHLSLAGMDIIPGLSLAGIGKVGVWLFFTLSSFLLTSQFISGVRNLYSIENWRIYFMRRVLRIYPLYTFVLLVGLIFKGSDYFNVTGVHDFILRLFLIQAKGVEWSILVEFRFYIVLPVIILIINSLERVLGSKTGHKWIVIALLVSSIALADVTRPSINLTSLRPYLSTFLMGVMAAYTTVIFDEQLNALSKNIKIILDLIALSVLVIIISLSPSIYGMIVGRVIPLDHFHGRLTEFSFLWSLVILACLYGAGLMRAILSLIGFRLIGSLSYGIYLWHPHIIKYVENTTELQSIYKACAVLILVFIISNITFFLIEKPFMKVSMHKLARR